MTRARRVLMIAYFYPPIGGAGVQRSAKFAKYLPDFGWEPYIISTTESVGGEELDPTLLADVRPGTPVWRIPTPRAFPLQAVYRRFPGLEQRALHGSRLTRLLLKAALFPLSVIESPPADPFFWWSLRIIPLALRVVAQHKIDVIYTTSSPWSSTIAGRVLKRLTGKPWVADFRDPWTHNEQFYFYRNGWRSGADQNMEAAALREACRVVTVMPMNDLLEWKSASRAKVHVIPNGYDSNDFAISLRHARQTGRTKPVSMLHMGTLYPGKYGNFFNALSQLEACDTEHPPLSLRFVGDQGLVRRYLDEWPNGKVEITFSPRVAHPQAVSLLQCADVLLFINTLDKTASKLFEYVASQTPILAITPPKGITAQIIHSTGTGAVVDPEDTDGMRRVLQQIAGDYEGFRAAHFRPEATAIGKFERRELTRQLAGVLDELVTV